MRFFLRKLTTFVIAVTAGGHLHAIGTEQVMEKQETVRGLVETIESSPVQAEYTVTYLRYYSPQDPDVEIVDADEDSIAFRYRIHQGDPQSRISSDARYATFNGVLITHDDGTHSLKTSTTFTYRGRQLGQDFIVERFHEGALHGRTGSLSGSLKSRLFQTSTGEVMIEQTGAPARGLVMVHFLPTSHAVAVRNAYDRLASPPDNRTFSIRSRNGEYFLEEHIFVAHKSQSLLGERWKVLDSGLLVRRQIGEYPAYGQSQYHGLQSFMDFPFPEVIERMNRGRDGVLTHRRIVEDIRITPASKEEFQADLDAFFEE